VNKNIGDVAARLEDRPTRRQPSVRKMRNRRKGQGDALETLESDVLASLKFDEVLLAVDDGESTVL
jgi:hypothetical protein